MNTACPHTECKYGPECKQGTKMNSEPCESLRSRCPLCRRSGYDLQSLKDLLQEALGLLEELEWAPELNGVYIDDYCPLCQNYKTHGHAEGCRFANLLARAGKGGAQ